MRKNNNKNDSLPKLSLEDEILKTSETLSLTDLIIRDYEKTNDDTKLRAYAAVFEQKHNNRDAFRLYERIGDENGIQRVAKRYFVRGLLLSKCEELVKKSGLELTPDLYNERGDYIFERSFYYHDAFEAYQKAGNVDGMKKSASKIEESGELKEAFEAYLILGDNESAYRLAKQKFISALFVNYGEKMFEKLNTPITKELWNERGDYQLSIKKDFDNALEAYQKTGNVEKVNLVLQTVAEQ